MKKKVKPKRNRIKTLKLKAWKLMSEIVRREENGVSFTNGERFWNEELGENDWKRMHAGHFIHNKLDFVRENIHCQTPKENTYQGGNMQAYTLKMIDTYGRPFVDELRIQAHQEKPYTEEALQGIIELLSRKLSSLRNATEGVF